ncbi:hypothetical protein CLV98_1453 [Dyadobacter jejuensis]|uniref:Uncharacterized protein n=2 Tax=Dyadobacter jejuensis TaxID=1082580 RepID=A0A315ZX29_9BACT|nr:hypothetical protein CLV98_1453 [Dyadobacter jejuensis]
MTMNGNPKNGATLIDGVLTDSNGKSAMALTQSSPWKHGTSSRMYFSRAAFSSREQLSVAMAHELGHLVFNNNAALFSMSNQVLSKTGLLNNEGHVALQNMTLKMINMNGWNQNLISNQVWKFDFQSRPLPQLESAIQFLIKNRIKFP